MKKERIDEIDNINSLTGLITQLLEKLDLSEIKRVSENILEASEISPLKKRKTYFILTLSELNGKVPTIGSNIDKVKSEADFIYIITTHKRLSNFFKGWIEKYCNYSNLDYWSRDNLIDLIDNHFSEFWGHGEFYSVL